MMPPGRLLPSREEVTAYRRAVAKDARWLHGQPAVFSADRDHRMFLQRRCGDMFSSGGHALFVMMNGSKADEERGDMTVTKCAGFAAQAGATRYGVVNLFSLMSTDPAGLLATDQPNHPDADRWARAAMAWCAAAPNNLLIFAHGNPPHTVPGFMDLWLARQRFMLEAARDAKLTPMALAFTADGWPRHPSRLGYEDGRYLQPVGADGRRVGSKPLS